jgi:signal transduction histidine kinase
MTPSPYERYQELQTYVRWTARDAARVQSLAARVTPHFHELIEDFYAEIERHPDARQVITGGAEQLNRLKRSLEAWLVDLFSGRYDKEYVERRWRIGYRHVEIGLDQVYTNAALSRLRSGLLALIESQSLGSVEEIMACRMSLNRLLDLDLAIIEDAYQTEYRRRQSAAERLATIGRIAGGVAHELRNPLNVVKTSVYYLLNAKNASPEKLRSHLERIERQVGVADHVITALNDFARLPFPQLEPIELHTCLRETFELNPMPANIRVECNVDPPGLAVLGDRAQLLIVFGNLVRNSRDAMSEGGDLCIDAALEDALVTVRVQDTGGGIPPEILPHILEPLYSTKAKGMGLGLSITNDIIRRHQGTLTVASKAGVGATFTVSLNAAL